MSVHRKRETWKACVELMVQRAIAGADPRDVGAYAAGTRNNILNGPLRDQARELLDGDESLTAEELLAHLDAVSQPPPTPSGSGAFERRTPSLTHIDHRTPCGTCGCYGGSGWLPATDRDEHGVTPDLEPCPVCNPDGVRDQHHRRDTTERADIHRRYRQGIDAHRARHTQPDSEARTA